MSTPAVSLRKVDFFYNREKVLDAVSFDIPIGDFTCLIGPNGGGKTTLLRILLGLLTPRRGDVRVFGEKPTAVLRRIGYLPQHARLEMEFPITVLDVVLMGLLRQHCFGTYSRRAQAAARQSLEDVGLDTIPHQAFNTLSGGQRQRALLARALVSKPDLLILDEPTSFLDPDSQSHLLELLNRLNKHMTILMVSHDVGFVSSYVRTVVCLNHHAAVHPISELSGQVVRDIYGSPTAMIHHDHGNANQSSKLSKKRTPPVP